MAVPSDSLPVQLQLVFHLLVDLLDPLVFDTLGRPDPVFQLLVLRRLLVDPRRQPRQHLLEAGHGLRVGVQLQAPPHRLQRLQGAVLLGGQGLPEAKLVKQRIKLLVVVGARVVQQNWSYERK